MAAGLVLIRIVIGSLMVGHGTGKLLGWFVGGGGVDATAGYFASLRYPRPRVMAVLAGSTEVAAGVAFGAGFMTPLAAAAIVGVMVNAAVAGHAQQGLWSENGGYEYPLVLAVVAVGIALIGPGDHSIDASLDWQWSGGGAGAVAAGIGLVSAVALLVSRRAVVDIQADGSSSGERE